MHYPREFSKGCVYQVKNSATSFIKLKNQHVSGRMTIMTINMQTPATEYDV